MVKRPLDPDGDKFRSDSDYEKAVDTIQNERYAEYILWRKRQKILFKVAAFFVVLAIIIFWLIK